MQKKNLIKSGVAVACLVVVSMFGFSAAFGYGGGGGGSSYVPACSKVVYGEWKNCFNGVQYRDITSQTPNSCALTASQQLDRSKTCVVAPVVKTPVVETPVVKTEPQVLGAKKYADGALLRGSDNKIYVVINGKLLQIANLKELAKYTGKEIIKVDDSIIASFSKITVLGVKKYGEGELIRNDNVKIYVIFNGKKKHISNLGELAKYYFGKPIYRVTADELAQY